MADEEANRLLDEDVLLLHAKLPSFSLPVVRLLLKKFTDFSNEGWKDEEQRDEVLSVAFEWCRNEGMAQMRVADRLYSGIENRRLLNVAQAVCETFGEDVSEAVVERVKACCALMILGVDAEFRTILADSESDANAIVREVLLAVEAQNQSDLSDLEDVPHAVLVEGSVAELLEAEEQEQGQPQPELPTHVALPAVETLTAEKLLCNCVRFRLAIANWTLDDCTLSDFVWKSVDDPAVMNSDPMDHSSPLYAFLGSSRVEALVHQVVAEASLSGLLKRVVPDEQSEQKQEVPSEPTVNKVEEREQVEEENIVLPRVEFHDEDPVATVMARTKASKTECKHVLEAVNNNVEEAIALLLPTTPPQQQQQKPQQPQQPWVDETELFPVELTERQQEAIEHFSATAMAASDEYMPRLVTRFRDCGFSEDQMIQTLHFMCTDAPITVKVKVSKLAEFVENGQLPSSAVATTLNFVQPTLPARDSTLLLDPTYYASTGEEQLPLRVSFDPAQPIITQNLSTGQHDVLLRLKGVHHRCTILYRLPWPAMGPEAVRIGTLQHCAHILDGYTDAQIRHLVAVAAHLPSASPFRLGVTVHHDAFIHGPVMLENVERVYLPSFGSAQPLDLSLVAALQNRGIIIDGMLAGPAHQPMMRPPANTGRRQRKGKQVRFDNAKPAQQNLGFAPPPAGVQAPQHVPLHLALEAEEADFNRAILESLRTAAHPANDFR